MIEINLVPGSTTRKKSAGKAKRPGKSAGRAAPAGPKMPAFDGALGKVAVAWVIGLGIIGYLHFTTSSTLGTLRTETEAAVRDSTRYAALRAQGDSLLAKERLIGQRMELIQQIDAGRYVWAHVIDELSRALPSYVWIVSVNESSTQDGLPMIRLEGRAGNYFALGRYIEDLEGSPFLRRVRLISSSQTQVDQRTVIGFVMEASYETPAADVIETVPLFGTAEGED